MCVYVHVCVHKESAIEKKKRKKKRAQHKGKERKRECIASPWVPHAHAGIVNWMYECKLTVSLGTSAGRHCWLSRYA